MQHCDRWAQFEAVPPSSICLEDVPWPPDSCYMLSALAALSMHEVQKQQQSACRPLCSNLDKGAVLKGAFRAASLQWHPDKFLARHADRLNAQDRPAIVQRLQALCQAINAEWKEASMAFQ